MDLAESIASPFQPAPESSTLGSVPAPSSTADASYAACMLKPYSRLLRRYPQIHPQFLDQLDAMDPDERVPIAPMLELLAGAVVLTGDPDIGLKAAREIVPGDYGSIEFLASSSSSIREAVDLLGRYLPLVNDALEFSLHVENGRALLRLDSRVPLPRAAADFQSAAFYVTTLQRGLPIDPHFEARFTHPEPPDLREYQRTFSPGKLCFGASWAGFSFDARLLEQPFASADANLHHVLRRYADMLLSRLPRSQSLSDRVRQLIGEHLQRGNPSVTRIARTLGMSRRTLARKLGQERTSFSDLLEDTRKQLALRYVRSHDLALTEIAFLLGFSQTGPFHRAFKRWTGQTPREYRRRATR